MSKKWLLSLTLASVAAVGCADSGKPMYTMAECQATAAAKTAAEKNAAESRAAEATKTGEPQPTH